MTRPLTRQARRKAAAPVPGEPVELTIERLGGRGDGIGLIEGVPAYVAGALPGERVRARRIGKRGQGWQARLEHILSPAPERIAPACRHFGLCGGCSLQHLGPDSYGAFKRARVSEALRRAGLGDMPVLDPIVTPPASRRRITLAARKSRAGLVLGFNEAASARVIDIAECPVAEPALVALLPSLRELAASLAPSALDLALLVLPGGVDLLLRAESAPGLADRERLAAFAASHDLARIAWQMGAAPPEPIAARRPVRTEFAGVTVDLPPGAFLQATAAGERAIQTAVMARLAAARAGPVADYFAGCGTLTLPIAVSGRAVHAVDGEESGLAALQKAARTAGLKVTTETRDIERRPPASSDLARYAALLFDPPRLGAAALARAIARSDLPLVIAVSCNPDSFARDARTLADAGYRLEEVQPIDQFLWSAHVELVAAFRR
jgi:23S rRNA (uracil1939-C5)-methyltransferase